MADTTVPVCDCRTVRPDGSHRRIAACYGQESADIGAVRSWSARVGEKCLEKRIKFYVNHPEVYSY